MIKEDTDTGLVLRELPRGYGVSAWLLIIMGLVLLLVGISSENLGFFLYVGSVPALLGVVLLQAFFYVTRIEFDHGERFVRVGPDRVFTRWKPKTVSASSAADVWVTNEHGATLTEFGAATWTRFDIMVRHGNETLRVYATTDSTLAAYVGKRFRDFGSAVAARERRPDGSRPAG